MAAYLKQVSTQVALIGGIMACGTQGNSTGGGTGQAIKLPVPEYAPLSVEFTDTDKDSGQVAGTIFIVRAKDESFISSYRIYWGESSTIKLNGEPMIAELAVSGENPTYTLDANTTVPDKASHLIVVSANTAGEMALGTSTAISDLVQKPSYAPEGISFSDTDKRYKHIGGTVEIIRASNEADITGYAVYWGKSKLAKLDSHASTPVITIAANGSNPSGVIATGTVMPADATHLVVFSSNSGVDLPIGAGVAITDALEAAAAPSFSVSAGTYSSPVTMVITSSSPGTTIYYTTDGTLPSTKSSVYTTAFGITKYRTTLRAIATGGPYSTSPETTGLYYVRTLQNLGYTLGTSTSVSKTDGVYDGNHLSIGTKFTTYGNNCYYSGQYAYRFYDGYLVENGDNYYSAVGSDDWSSKMFCSTYPF